MYVLQFGAGQWWALDIELPVRPCHQQWLGTMKDSMQFTEQFFTHQILWAFLRDYEGMLDL